MFVVCAFLTLHATAAEQFIETITLDDGASHAATKMGAGIVYTLTCDGTIYYKTCITSSCTATTSDVKVANFEVPFDIPMPPPFQWMALIRSGGSTVTCNFFKVHDTLKR